jgi:hypothetical protein
MAKKKSEWGQSASQEIDIIRGMPEQMLESMAVGRMPDAQGLVGKHKQYGWVQVALQRGGMIPLWIGVALAQHAWIDGGLRAIEAAMAQQIDTKRLGPIWESGYKAVEALEQRAWQLQRYDAHTTNRLMYDAQALMIPGRIYEVGWWSWLGRHFTMLGIDMQREDGAFQEAGADHILGHDSSYHGVSLLQFQQYAIHFRWPPYRPSIERAVEWIRGRILRDPDGKIDCTGNTRVDPEGDGEDFLGEKKQVDYVQMILGLFFYANHYTEGDIYADAERVVRYAATSGRAL